MWSQNVPPCLFQFLLAFGGALLWDAGHLALSVTNSSETLLS